MASLAINLMVLLFTLVVSTAKGFKIENTQSNTGFEKRPNFYSESFQYPSFSIENSNFPVQPFTRQYQNVNEGPIAGYPKVPPNNAYESGGVDGDLLPPLEESSSNQKRKNQFFRRSTEFEKFGVNSQPSYPLFVSTSYENSDDNQEILKFSSENPLLSKNIEEEKAVDPKTGYPLTAHPSWQDAGGNGDTLELPLEENDKKTDEEKIDPKTGYPLQAQPHWKDAGGNGDMLELPLEENYEKTNEGKVDPKTGYPLQAQPHWKDAGGNEDILELPLEDSSSLKNSENESAVDPKTGYPLKAEPFWKDAGGNEDNLELPLEEELSLIPPKTPENEMAVDPKTKYPLQAEPHWKDAGGNEDILELPLEDPLPDSLPSKAPENNAVDPKTGYPLKAEPQWKDAGGNEDILELPLEDSSPSKNSENESAVDPKTGYPLRAEPFWRDAGGNEEILELPLEDPLPLKTPESNNAVDPKTGYPLKAEPHWKDAGGNGDILDLPLEFTEERKNIDKKTGYPFVAELNERNANGNKKIVDLPLENNMNRFMQKSEVEAQQVNPKTNYPFLKSLITGTGDDTLNQPVSNVQKNFKIDPKTGYPLMAQPEWNFAGGDGNILQLPLNDYVNQIQGRSGELLNEDLLTELRPPSPESNYFTGFGSFPFSSTPFIFTQTPAFGGVHFFDNNRIPRRPFVESENTRQQKIYTLTYPDNAVVTVSHYTINDNQNVQNAPERLTSFNQKQFIQSFTGEKTQNNKGNAFLFPITHTAVNQQFKTYQPSAISNFQTQQHQFRQHPPFLISNIETSFT